MPLFSERNNSAPVNLDLEHRPAYAGRICGVAAGSPAESAGACAGDLLLSVNGHALQDVIDVQFYAAEPECELELQGPDGQKRTVAVVKTIDEPLGLLFEDDLFDGVRLCANRCDFCFVDQQPAGMRSSLAIRDDDFRLSFLHGNFVTLTNLSSYDWKRVFIQRLSPLYISVHATDLQVRGRLLRNKQPHDIMQQLRSLLEGGIEVHTQIVLCRGLNDGRVLDDTISDLAALYPGVKSLAVVPMGVTDYRLARNESLQFDGASSRLVLDQLRRHQKNLERSLGTRFVVPSDEFYLLANRPIPKAYTYDGFPQLSNGVGGSRLFLDELAAVLRRLEPRSLRGRVQIVTSVLAAPLLERFAEGVSEKLSCELQVVPAVNNWYGPSVTVAGLLTGRDVRDALNKAGHADLVLLPDIMLREGTDTFLDDLTVKKVTAETGKRIVPVPPHPSAALQALVSNLVQSAA